VAHAPYRFGAAEVSVWDDTMLRLAGFDPAGRGPDHVGAAEAVDVEIFGLEKLGSGRAAARATAATRAG
jgi:hypothetical protein